MLVHSKRWLATATAEPARRLTKDAENDSMAASRSTLHRRRPALNAADNASVGDL